MRALLAASRFTRRWARTATPASNHRERLGMPWVPIGDRPRGIPIPKKPMPPKKRGPLLCGASGACSSSTRAREFADTQSRPGPALARILPRSVQAGKRRRTRGEGRGFARWAHHDAPTRPESRALIGQRSLPDARATKPAAKLY